MVYICRDVPVFAPQSLFYTFNGILPLANFRVNIQTYIITAPLNNVFIMLGMGFYVLVGYGKVGGSVCGGFYKRWFSLSLLLQCQVRFMEVMGHPTLALRKWCFEQLVVKIVKLVKRLLKVSASAGLKCFGLIPLDRDTFKRRRGR